MEAKHDSPRRRATVGGAGARVVQVISTRRLALDVLGDLEQREHLAHEVGHGGRPCGELKINKLRREANAALGDRFDLRVFHDVVAANVRRWIDEAKQQ